MMMQKIAIGLAAAVIATGGSTLSASAARGVGGHVSHGGGFSKGGMGRIGMGRGGTYRPGRVSGLEGRYRPGRAYGFEERYRRDRRYGPEGRMARHDRIGMPWCLKYPNAPQCRGDKGHWETRYWSRWGRYGGGYGGGYGRGGGSCWRWVETRLGPERIWVCGRGYGRGYGSAGSYRYGGSYRKWVPGRQPGPIGHGPIGHGRMK